MENRLTEKSRKVHIEYIWANTKNCKACWECINACPKQVISKINFLWHKHIAIRNAENCIGCKKCIKVCPHGVLVETNRAV
jgi:2-oxoglutarate ferredoxin oxidoreductase subunit delta